LYVVAQGIGQSVEVGLIFYYDTKWFSMKVSFR
jgi:hypothetical protein